MDDQSTRSDSLAPDDPAAARSAMRDSRSHLRLWPVAVIALIADLWSKHWAFSALPPEPGRWELIPNLMSFQRSLNTGALFGLGKGMTPVFIAASILALGFVLYLFIHSTPNRRSLHVALGLVLAGALGNLYDRAFVIADVVQFQVQGRTAVRAGVILGEYKSGISLAPFPEGDKQDMFIPTDSQPQVRRQGVVRDFIKMEPRIGSVEIWPWVFNLADAWLVIGVALLMLNFWFDRREAVQLGKDAAGFEVVKSA